MSERRKPYPFDQLEPKWQTIWDERGSFHVPNPGDPAFDASKPKFYILDMFPYPSGAGLHVGHPEGYTATDIVARYKRMRGCNVLHPMGWDAFGLPAEQYAIKTGQHPAITTAQNIAKFKTQLKRIGFSYDWDREVSTADPTFFRWNPMDLLQIYNSWFNPETRKAEPISTFRGGDPDSVRLAYVAEVPVNWCPELGTVLANEEVIDGKSEVGGFPVVRRPMRQWMLRITAFAERLIDELDGLDWPEGIKLLQRNWIGKSEGAEIRFEIADGAITVFTTRPDTLFGATYLVLAPENPLVDQITTAEQGPSVDEYRKLVAAKSDLERTALAREKTGVFTGGVATNPANGESIPIWIADYVLTGYGTGAIMAVPAHDARDFEFATKFALPIKPVICPPDTWLKAHVSTEAVVGVSEKEFRGIDLEDPAMMAVLAERYAQVTKLSDANYCEDCVRLFQKIVCTGEASPDELQSLRFCYQAAPDCFLEDGNPTVFADDGYLIESGPFDGLPASVARNEIIVFLQNHGFGRKTVIYKLRDWLFSRQRYWGEPFPIVWENGRHHSLGESELPLVPPDLEDFKPTGTSEPPLAKAKEWLRYSDAALRETNTMPQWAGSCWYYLRFCDPANDARFVGEEAERYWMGGAQPGGVDLYVGGTEHAVLHLLYARFWHKVLFDLGYLSKGEPFQRLVNQGMILGEDGRKMSKRWGNVIDPLDVIAEYGADAFRCYEMFMGPLEQMKPWSMKGVEGVSRFLARVWRLIMEENQAGEWVLSAQVQESEPEKAHLKVLHATIKKVTEDIETLSFNTAISQMMILVNALTNTPVKSVPILRSLLVILNPFAPHLTSELWEVLHQKFSGGDAEITTQTWPSFDERLLVEDEVEIIIQVNGKMRDKIVLPLDATNEEMEKAALASPKIQAAIAGKTVVKVVVVPKKLVNVVAS